MKKSILALLVLLFLLILTCVYQKTDVIYAKYNDHPQNTSPTIILKPLHMVKKLVEVKREEKVTKVAEIAQEEVKKEIKITKPKTEVVKTPVIKQEIPTVTSPVTAPAKKKDIEEIDALMQALKNREIAFKNRDKFELYIQRLIKQALDNRTIAISHMNNEELHLIEIQKELIKASDHTYNKIGQTNNTTSGE